MDRRSLCEPLANHKGRIVDDLIPIILESDGHWWQRDLHRLALTSSSWVGPTRRLLYACPKLDSFHACTLFVRTLSANSHLLPLLRGLDLRPTLSDSSAVTDEVMASLRFVLNIKGLLSVTLGGELGFRAERFIHMMANAHTVTSLHIDGTYISLSCERTTSPRSASLSWDDSIAFRFSRSLRTLRLTNINLSIADADIPYALRVRDLALEDVCIESGFIQDLLHESWGHVRHLRISSAITRSYEDIALPLLESCEHLESFCYEASSAGSDGALLEEDLPGLSTLQTLRLYDIDLNPQSLNHLAQACRNLVRLSLLGRVIRLPAHEWVRLLRSGALPSLRVLEISSGSNRPPAGFIRWPPETCSELSSVCDTRGVSLLYA